MPQKKRLSTVYKKSNHRIGVVREKCTLRSYTVGYEIDCRFQRADIGMGLYSWLKERALVVDYSRMLGADTWTVLMKNKGTANVIRGNLISPFDYQVNDDDDV